ncbi:MAG: hypothetical protein PHQ23_00320 [Candidatus Wallbacteria bacterium]|nr:hypothetical protein [Candidatus Wallbacteria bacterium]
MVPRLIIAGITNLNDALTCLDAGVDGISFIFYNDPRQLSPDKASEISMQLPHTFSIIGEFADIPMDKLKSVQRQCRLTAVRLSGCEDTNSYRRINCNIIRLIRLKPGQAAAGGWGIALPEFCIVHREKNAGNRIHLWMEAGQSMKSCPHATISGRISLDNLENVMKLKPYAVRINSGAEQFIGKKDPAKINEILRIMKKGLFA